MNRSAIVSAVVVACALTFADTLMAQQGSSPSADSTAYPHANEAIGTVRQMYDGALTPEMAVHTFRNIDRLFPTRAIAHGAHPKPLPLAASPLDSVRFRDGDASYDLEQYLDLNRVAGILVLKGGRIALECYRYGNSERTRWMSMSVAKSITSTLVGAALAQHRITSLAEPVTKYVTSLSGSAYDGVSVRDILMMSSGVRWNETYTDPASDRRHLLEAQISQQPGSAMRLMGALPRAAQPGFVNNYSTGETQVAGEIVRNAVGRPLADYLADRIWSRYAMEADARWWLDSPNGHEIGGSGFSATLRDYGRFGQFILDGGIAHGEPILPKGWIHDATTPKTLRSGAALPYGYFWWPGTSPKERRDGAFEANGIFGQHIYINPAAHLVIVVWGAQTKPTGGAIIDDWKFFDAVAAQLR
jgi:CubicO group peptidase (beta-lactamase class C family)